jgi:hypothetical protein
LAARLLGHNVEIVPSPYQDGRGVVALVHLRVDQSVAQLEAGLASYSYFGPYALDWYRECVYKRAQHAARSGQRGIWALR